MDYNTNNKNIYVDGIFDLFHEGHINLLKQAASYGRLIVGVCSDAFAENYKRKPFMPETTRYAVVGACRYVDEVIMGVGCITDEMIDTYQIDLVLHGDDYSDHDVETYYKAALDRGIFQYLPYTKHISSSKIIKEIENRFKNQ